ncbi:hypothetical protein EEDFHM_01708 [Methylorubrum populi]
MAQAEASSMPGNHGEVVDAALSGRSGRKSLSPAPSGSRAIEDSKREVDTRPAYLVFAPTLP